MAKSFTITTTATDTLKADAKGHAQAVFTVTNATARPVRGMARAKPLGDTTREWLSIAGETERDFGGGATEQFSVSFDAAGAAAGKYPFRLDVASAMNPDEDFTEGPTVVVEVAGIAAPPEPKKKFPSWIIFVIIGVVVVVGVVVLIIVVSSGGKGKGNGKPTPTPEPPASPTPKETPKETPRETPKPVATFEGEWANTDPNTPGITRLIINVGGTQVKVHAFGKCHPTDCDWGVEGGAISGNAAQVAWNQGFVVRRMVLVLEGEKRLHMVLDSVFNDTRPRQHAEYDFVRTQ